jgi:uncharacterized protein YyaL (SSP411 family)
MAHESFEDQEVADALNADFIAVKVDREERPDVDDIYMKALQTLSGGGGWPMSVWLTPEGKPFFAGTYFPKFRFLQLSRRIAEIWAKDSEALRNDGERLLKAMASDIGTGDAGGVPAADLEERREFLRAYTNHFQFSFDERNGGFGSAPKFPQTMNLMVMRRQDCKTGLRQGEALVLPTLRHMVRGGIFDQLMGGFHRYSVDERWLVPHFEKMLYDQALITVTLLEAHALYGEPELRRAAEETLNYVLREMTDAAGGFYSAQDADSEADGHGQKHEGYFATFTYDELRANLGDEELAALERVYGVTRQGQFEGRNILHLQDGYDGAEADRDSSLRAALVTLRRIRAARPSPHLDDKIIAAWNGWMIWALARAAAATIEGKYAEKYLGAAGRAFAFARENLWDGTRLRRYWRQGKTEAAAAAEDYAALILAGLELSQVDPDPSIAAWVIQLQAAMDRDFWDTAGGAYFSGDGRDPLLPLRLKDDYDGVSPCANSMAAYNLLRLYALTGDGAYRAKAERILELFFPKLKQFPSALPFLALATEWSLADARVAVCGAESVGGPGGGGWPADFRVEQGRRFLPFVQWAAADSGWPVASGKSAGAVHVCKEGVCLAPARDGAEALRQITS